MGTASRNRHARARSFRGWRPGIRRVLPRIPGGVMTVLAELKARGFQAFLVGGALRDLFLGRPPGDWDVATGALPGQVEEVFPDRLVVHTGKRFGTVRVLAGEIPVDVTTFRREGAYTDGRRPDWVEFKESVVDDLSRRDFTVNAMALDPFAEKLVDPFRGRRDLRRRLIRTVGDPQARFREDALRMLRFYRFQAVDFHGGGDRTGYCPIAAEEPSLLASQPRTSDELNKLPMAWPAKWAGTDGLLPIIAPEFAPVVGPGVNGAPVATVEAIKPEPPALGASHDLGKPVTGLRMAGFIISAEQAGENRPPFLNGFASPGLSGEVFWSGGICSLRPGNDDTALRRLVAKVGRPFDLLELRRADIVASGTITTGLGSFPNLPPVFKPCSGRKRF